MNRTPLSVPGLVLLALAPAAIAQDDVAFLRNDVLGKLTARSLGPVNFGGRIVDFAVDPRTPSTFYVAAATGGLWKTVNNGVKWTCVFERESSSAIGDVAIAPSNGEVLYLGSGENNNQRSSYSGDGVYKTSDGGKTWTNVGLRNTAHVGRIAVHPQNPDVVFVAALGTLYTPNPDRGLYRSKDGGKTWTCVKHVSAQVGFVDVAIDPRNPDVVYAASYERLRRAHNISQSGPGSGLWKSTDGGETWSRLDKGLPSGDIGRIGIDLFAADPKVLVATIENRNPAPIEEPAARAEREPVDAAADRKDPDAGAKEESRKDGEAAPAADVADDPRRRVVGGEVYRSDDAGASWRKVNKGDIGGNPGYYYGQIRVDPKNDQVMYVLSVRVHVTRDGGKTWKQDLDRTLHSDHHALWIDPADPQRMLLGNDGGFAISYDRGEHWDYMNDLPIGQFYAIGVDMRSPYWVWGGTQDNGTWGIPSAPANSAGLTRNDARKINGGDGFYVCVDPTDPAVVYSESQFGGLSRQNLRTGERRSIRPRVERGQPALRFNWMTPIVLSPHDPDTVYVGTQYLHRSRNRGDTWETISHDLTTNDPEKLKGNVPHCTITTVAESKKKAGLLYAGTDDGRVWMTRNGGERWTELSERFAGLPKALWVSRVEPSAHDADVCYVAFTGYREDLRTPFLYVTADGGETWRPIVNGLPQSSINVVREDPRSEKLLFAGTEQGVWCSLDAGGTWHPLGKNLPTNPVHDLVIHPRDRDLVIGTHGRGLWVMDIGPLEELSEEVLAKPFHAFAPRDGRLLARAFGNIYSNSARRWAADAVEPGATFRYYLRESMDQAPVIKVTDATGKVLFERKGETKAGLHQVVWSPGRGGGPGGGVNFGQRGGARPPALGPGQYALEITHGETSSKYPFRLEAMPGWVATAGPGEEEERTREER